MIISDLSYLEVASEQVVGGRGGRGGTRVDKEIYADVDFDQEFTVDIKVDKDVNVDVKVDSDADIKGNIASLNFDVEAIGSNTLAELDFVVLAVEGELSSVSGYAIAGAD